MVHRYHVTVNDHTYQAEVEDGTGDVLTVRVDGEVFQVRLAPANGGTAAVQAVTAEVPQAPAPTVEPADVAPQPATSAEPVGEGGKTVIAPMPGTVMDIAVKVGDEVHYGETLCNLEAMKMKSPIRATADGILAEIRVSEGQSVGYGEVLFVLR